MRDGPVTVTTSQSPLLQMVRETPTDNWNDSCAVDELTYAVERGATGATSNPTIVHEVWTELVGGDLAMTMPHAWQVRFNKSGIGPEPRIDLPVAPAIVDELLDRVPDFRRAYEPDGMTPDEFELFGASARTLRSFIKSYHDLMGAVRDLVLPDPDKRVERPGGQA